MWFSSKKGCRMVTHYTDLKICFEDKPNKYPLGGKNLQNLQLSVLWTSETQTHSSWGLHSWLPECLGFNETLHSVSIDCFLHLPPVGRWAFQHALAHMYIWAGTEGLGSAVLTQIEHRQSLLWSEMQGLVVELLPFPATPTSWFD